MAEVVWTRKAQNSLKKIWNFYAEKDLNVANRIVNEILSSTERIKYVNQFQVEEYLTKRHRRIVVKHFKVIYTSTRRRVQVLDVFDTRQSPDKMKP